MGDDEAFTSVGCSGRMLGAKRAGRLTRDRFNDSSPDFVGPSKPRTARGQGGAQRRDGADRLRRPPPPPPQTQSDTARAKTAMYSTRLQGSG